MFWTVYGPGGSPSPLKEILMRRIVAIGVGLGLVGVFPSAATAQSSELAALAAHVQALQATITVQAGQIAALQTATGTATVPSLDDDEAWVRGGPRNSDSLLRWDPDQGEGVWHATEETKLFS